MKIILGTASPQRRQVFESMGYEFTVMTADIDEKAIRFENPKELTIALAKAKAETIFLRVSSPCLLITADQVIMWKDEMREKPEGEEQARHYLATLHEFPCHIVNGIVVTNTETGKQVTANDISIVRFKQIPDDVITNLIQEGKVFGWAGGFATEDPVFIPYIETIQGEEGSGRGLPKNLTEQLIKEAHNSALSRTRK